MKVKTDFTGCDYITPGKEYDCAPYNSSNHVFFLLNDQEDLTIIRLFGGCAHLKGNHWQIVEDVTND